ncbi:MAG: hypothetical protein ABSB32_06035 [Thermodesulfobacteriota bacterium]|jgi:hypothetical protein
MENKIFYQGIALLLKTFSISPDEQTIEVWKMLLHDVGDEDFIKAVIHLCRTKEKILPNVVAAIRNEIEANNFSPEESWQKVLEEISGTGSWGEPKFDDPSIAQAVKSIGWKHICATEVKDMGTLRAHFYRTVKVCRERASLMETYRVIETNLEIKKMLANEIGKLNPKNLTS